MTASDVQPSSPPPGRAGPARPTIVGIGASAGGLEALKRFFAAVPPDSGLAYVVVVHLSADRESHLADLLRAHATIPVMQVTEPTSLEPDQIYVIPPDRNLSAVDSHLRLSPLEEQRRDRAPIDHFFRTLADAFDGRSVAVILSGSGSDGTQGVRRIRERGGLVVVQDPVEAEFDGMPRSALATGVADLVLPVEQMPRRILEFDRTHPDVGEAGAAERAPAPDQDRVPRILTHVRARTGHDFSRYKRSTLERRIERRMQLQGVEELPAYLELLRASPLEAAALADDLLINVTSFFRDRPVFEYLERHVVPELLARKSPGSRVRVWSVGCATGEEAYSLGMLLMEAADGRESPPEIQIFASDLHERSLHFAREGLYPETIAADVSPERLKRFFQEESGGYRVRKPLREMVVFAPHNLLRDPPFSHLDLVCCRNVLIYLQRSVQEEVIELFHYALHDTGYLLLGTAETVEHSELFRLESKEHHLYQRRNIARSELRLPTLPLSTPAPASHPGPGGAPRGEASLAYGALHERMVERYAPPSLLVNQEHAVLHVSEHASRFLRVSGVPSTNVFKLIREELRMELRAALHLARERRTPSRSRPIPLRIDGEMRYVVLRVSPPGAGEMEGLALVLFDELGEAPPAEGAGEHHASMRELEADLDATRNRLQALVEEYETGQEEMRASNEELQSANEELRSTLEELETSREELQSINEELQTVNQENRHKVEELSQLSSDLQNLLKSTDVATLFLDRSLRILRFTPRVGELFNVRHTDRGRPLADLTHRLGYDGLLADANQVLQTLVPVEREVESEDGRWYLTRVIPYRTAQDHIDGVVITLVDVTTLKRTEQALRESEARYHTLFDSIDQGFCLVEVLFDPDGEPVDYRFLEVNRAFETQTGLRNAAGKRMRELEPRHEEQWFQIYGRIARTGEPERFVQEAQYLGGRWYDLYAFRVGGAEERRVAVLFTDISERMRSEAAMREAKELAEQANRAKSDFLAVMSHELRTPLNAIAGYVDLLNLGIYGSLSADQQTALARILKSEHHLLRLINDVLSYARLESGSVTYDFRNVPLREVLSTMEAILEPQVRARGLALQVSQCDPDLTAWSDAEKLSQIVLNLASNAVKFTQPGGRIEFSAEEGDDEVHLVVRDTGIGIPADRLESIFEPFMQIRSDLTRTAEGTGLGLAISRDLARAMDGDLTVESTPGEGSVFTVRIPRGSREPAP